LFEHDLFGKPVPTFPDHAQGSAMKVDGKHFRSIWLDQDGWSVGAIDQRKLPHEFVVARLTTCAEAADAIRSMLVRGAPLIGATAAYGMALAMRDDRSEAGIERAYRTLIATRPTAINLKWALDEMRAALRRLPPSARVDAAYARADDIAEQDIAIKFREAPYSVDMQWLRNSQGAARIDYVAGRFRQSGKELAVVYPAGLLGAFAPNGVKLDIRSPQMLRGRERGIDGFGFKKTLTRIIETCERSKDQSGYSLDFLGVGVLQGRECLVFRRILPDTGRTPSQMAGVESARPASGQSEPEIRDSARWCGDERRAPMLLIYMDREWLVPLGCFEYEDAAGESLIGSFVTTDVELNVGLSDADF